MPAIEIECPYCYVTSLVETDGQTCRCGHQFYIGDPSVLDGHNSAAVEELERSLSIGRQSGLTQEPAQTIQSKAALDALAQLVLVTTETFLPGATVKERFGIVSAEHVSGVNIVRDFIVGLTDVFGGRSGTLQTELNAMRVSCLKELQLNAAKLGANAIISTQLSYNPIPSGGTTMLMLVITGTAALIEWPEVQPSISSSIERAPTSPS